MRFSRNHISIVASTLSFIMISLGVTTSIADYRPLESTKRDDIPKPPPPLEQKLVVPAPPQPERPAFVPRSRGYDILVEKSSRTMTIYVSGKPYQVYNVSLGFTPEGDKTRRGDGRTPEGRYYVCKRNEASAYYRSLLISYPSPKDAKEGVEAGLVGQPVLWKVQSAYSRGAQPPQDTRLGGNICIHGEGSRKRSNNDWTAGCVAVSNEEMREIFAATPIGTPVTIRP